MRALLTIAAFLAVMLPVAAQACMPPVFSNAGNLEAQIKTADYVFVGTVIEVTSVPGEGRRLDTVTYSVDELLKGDLGATHTIEMSVKMAMPIPCGPPVDLPADPPVAGQEFLILSNGDARQLSSPLSEADLALLEDARAILAQ